MVEEHFYALLGEYLYALALSDGRIQEKEIRELENLVREELENPEGDKEIIFTKLRFFQCMNKQVKREEATLHFFDFCVANKKRIGDHQLQLAKELIRRVEAAYRGSQAAEEELVQKLEKFF